LGSAFAAARAGASARPMGLAAPAASAAGSRRAVRARDVLPLPSALSGFDDLDSSAV